MVRPLSQCCEISLTEALIYVEINHCLVYGHMTLVKSLLNFEVGWLGWSHFGKLAVSWKLSKTHIIFIRVLNIKKLLYIYIHELLYTFANRSVPVLVKHSTCRQAS